MNKKLGLSFFADTCEKEKCEGGVLIRGLFSVGPTSQVRFAPSNLAEDGRSFVSHQWEYGGYFGWGTGNNPSKISTDYLDYSEFDDWGSYIESGWRTLSRDEWFYIINQRENAFSKVAAGTVNGVHGLILLPDGCSLPTGCTFNAGMNGWEGNIYTLTQWLQMEEACAVFLPAAGSRGGSNVYDEGDLGYYWSSTPYDAYHACNLFFNNDILFEWNNNNPACGFPVRLVRDEKN